MSTNENPTTAPATFKTHKPSAIFPSYAGHLATESRKANTRKRDYGSLYAYNLATSAASTN